MLQSIVSLIGQSYQCVLNRMMPDCITDQDWRLLMRFGSLLLLGAAALLPLAWPGQAIAREPVGQIECGSMDGCTRSDEMYFVPYRPVRVA